MPCPWPTPPTAPWPAVRPSGPRTGSWLPGIDPVEPAPTALPAPRPPAPSAEPGRDPDDPGPPVTRQPARPRPPDRPPAGGSRGAARERGAATVELVAVIPMLAALTLALVGIVLLSSDQVLVTAAAREGARAAALGEPSAKVAATTRAVLPERGRRADIQIKRTAPDQVSVRVRLPARLAGGAGLTVSATAVAAVEPDQPPPTTGASRSPGQGAALPPSHGRTP